MQKKVWENEYRNPRLVSGSREPQTSVKDFLRWLRREQNVTLEKLRALDLGCGNGKNSIYIAGLDPENRVVGIDISETAIAEARAATTAAMHIEYFCQSIGERFGEKSPKADTPVFSDSSFDIALDVTSSNSLSESERAVYLSETHRVLKPGGYFFVRALAKDGDKNAQTLIKTTPGPEKDTYIMPEIGLVERVFSRDDFIATYSASASANHSPHSPLFSILHLEKETHYTKFAGRSYKRNFWVAYLQKK